MSDQDENSDETITMTRDAFEAATGEAVKEAMREARENAKNDDSDPLNFALISDDQLGEQSAAEQVTFDRDYAVRHDLEAMEMSESSGLQLEDGKVQVGEPRDMQGYTGVCIQTYNLLCARVANNYTKAHEIQDRMKDAGMYDEYRQREGLTDNQGVPFLPTAIADRIDVIREQVGVARDLVTVFNLTEGSVKFPGVQSKVDVGAVGEGQQIPGKNFSTEEVELDPKKWGAIHPFSTDLNNEVGAQYVDNLVEAVGTGFAQKEDETVLTADGTGAYHSITGLLNDANVNEFTLPSGSQSFTDMTYDDWLSGMEKVAPALFDSMRSVFHPALRFTFRRMEDNGGYLFPRGSDLPDELEFTEALDGPANDSADNTFGITGDFSYIHMALQRDMTADMLTEGTVQKEDGTDVRLAQQDMVAMRFTSKWDVDRNQLAANAFSKYTTAS